MTFSGFFKFEVWRVKSGVILNVEFGKLKVKSFALR